MAIKSLCKIEGCGKPVKGRGWCCGHYDRWRNHGDPLGGGTAHGEPLKYLLDVVLPYDGDECLPWPFATDQAGYAQQRYLGKTRRTARIVCERTHGPAPTPKHEAAHSCGRGHLGCATKRHLRWATRKENDLDKSSHGTYVRGERQGRSRLTEDNVRTIRSLKGKMNRDQVGAMFGVHPVYVSQIQRRMKWAWLA